MSAVVPKTIAFFNTTGGFGKTTLVYHIAWMMKELGYRTLAVDLDPQCNLTSAFLSDTDIEDAWADEQLSILGVVKPRLEHMSDVNTPDIWGIDAVGEANLDMGLLAGNIGLSAFEDRLALAWPACLEERQATRDDAFRVITAFYRTIVDAAVQISADVALIDMGPNLGALNRAALVAADYVVIPMAADLFSLRGLMNLGPALREWRSGWQRRLEQAHDPKLLLPAGTMTPIGYVLQPAGRERTASHAFQYWIDKVPGEYCRSVLGCEEDGVGQKHLLGTLKNYLSLIPLAQRARKPVFALRAADGALGSLAVAAKASFGEFEALVRRIATACELRVP